MIGLLAMAAASATVQPGDLKTYRDWIVGCDNGRACQAVSLMPEDGSDAVSIVIARGAESGARPTLSISAPNALLRIGRKGVRAGAKGEIAAGDTAAVLDAVRRESGVAVTDAKGKPIGTISFAGASAALLYMDDQQKRVGTVTALARKGPATAVPAPPALPVIARPAPGGAPPRTIPRAQAIKALGDLECGEEAQSDSDPEFVRLDPAHTLALVMHPCGNGAYNYFYDALLVDEKGRVTQAEFESPAGMGEDSDSLVNAGWNAERGVIESMMKGRGIGDCGVSSDYAWDGAHFRLAGQSAMGECRGSTDYIPVWRARLTGGR